MNRIVWRTLRIDVSAQKPAPALGLFVLPFAQWSNGHMDWDDGWWLMVLVMGIGWLGGLALLAWFLRVVIADRAGPRDRTDSALEIARERFARGEIDESEFERIRRGLGH